MQRRAILLGLAGLAAGRPGPARAGFGLADGGALFAAGDDVAALRPVVERVIGSAVMAEAIAGLIVGISWQGRRSYFGFSGTGDAPFRPDTIVEIGSITKVFTTALFAEALNEGRMRRDAPIQSYLPARRLQPCTGQITPLQLADFTSGMPELPGNVPRALAERGIETYTREDFLDWVARWRPEPDADGLACALPAPYRYSNASIGLLGELVAEQLGKPWEALLHERITGPLRMHSTAVRVPPDQRARLAQGFGRDGRPAMPWPVFAWYAAGALRSTAADMLAFGEAALGAETTAEGAPVPPHLAAALRTAMQPVYQPADRPFGQGMAWVEDAGNPAAGQHPLFLKDGGTDGFNSVLVVNPAKTLAIFLCGNRPALGIPHLGTVLSRRIR